MKIINFNNVTPAPLAGVINLQTDVWQRTCTFEAGKNYRIVAPSGKGKSTFIHCVYGLRYDFSGSVEVFGKDTRSFNANGWADLRQQKISIVYQDLRLFLNLTAWQNLEVKSALYPAFPTQKLRDMAERLNVSHVLEKKAVTLSYGERQRIAIIRALIQPFEVLLLDEPFSHLDKDNAWRAATLIKEELAARNAGAIVTSLGEDNFFNYEKEFLL
jgi:ABC-type lipoprotein export system ATPase subunit